MPSSNITLSAKVNWLTCEISCIPQEEDLSLTLHVSSKAVMLDNISWISSELKKIPIPINNLDLPYTYDNKENSLLISIENQDLLIEDIFIANQIENYSYDHILLEKTQRHLYISIPYINQFKEDIDILLTPPKGSYVDSLREIPSISILIPNTNKEYSLITWLYILLLSFLGGILLNFFPCVFPVLALKIYWITQKSTTTKDYLYFLFGILTTFTLLGLLLMYFKEIGTSIGWGFQFQSPIFVSIMALFFLAFSLNLMNVFQFPSLAIPLSIQRANSNFSHGVILTLASTPCSAPFIGSGLFYSLTLPPLLASGIFISMGLGLGLPTLLLGKNKRLKSFFISKKTTWIHTFKQFLAFPLIFTSIWLISLSHSLNDSNLTIFSTLLPYLVFSLGLFFFGKYQLSKLFQKKIYLLFLILSFLLGLLLSIRSINKDFLSVEENSSPWQSYSPSLTNQFLNENKTFLIQFTADWCINCKFLESSVLNTEDSKNLFKENNIYLVKADWTKKNADIAKAVNSYAQAGIPLITLTRADGKYLIFPKLFTLSYFLKEVRQFLNE